MSRICASIDCASVDCAAAAEAGLCASVGCCCAAPSLLACASAASALAVSTLMVSRGAALRGTSAPEFCFRRRFCWLRCSAAPVLRREPRARSRRPTDRGEAPRVGLRVGIGLARPPRLGDGAHREPRQITTQTRRCTFTRRSAAFYRHINRDDGYRPETPCAFLWLPKSVPRRAPSLSMAR